MIKFKLFIDLYRITYRGGIILGLSDEELVNEIII